MRILYLLLIGWLAAALNISAQGQNREVRVTTPLEGVTVAIYDARGTTVSVGKTPFLITLHTDSTYSYRARHRECHSDSGTLRIDATQAELALPVRPYEVQVEWQITPGDARYRFVPLYHKGGFLQRKKYMIAGPASGQTVVPARTYLLAIRRDDCRTFRQKFRFHSDSTVVIAHHLQSCPTRLLVALNAGLGSDGCLPMGLTVGYGSTHGIYGRYMQTFAKRGDGDDFDTSSLSQELANPYSDSAIEYFSLVAGYQYLTPCGLYLQLGVGYGASHTNWLSAADGKRHRYTPDDVTGIVFDLGAGYLLGRYYVGAALQTLQGGSPSFAPVCGMINLGISL